MVAVLGPVACTRMLIPDRPVTAPASHTPPPEPAATKTRRGEALRFLETEFAPAPSIPPVTVPPLPGYPFTADVPTASGTILENVLVVGEEPRGFRLIADAGPFYLAPHELHPGFVQGARLGNPPSEAGQTGSVNASVPWSTHASPSHR